MGVVQTIGLILFASLFVLSGLKHIRNHAAMAGFTTTTMGNCPIAGPLGYMGGWPTGVFLVVFGVGTAINQWSIFAYGLAAFLLVATALFHRDFLTDPGGFKTLSLAGAALVIASQVR